jgi:hypothetical protein
MKEGMATVLTDIRMPGEFDGAALACQIRRQFTPASPDLQHASQTQNFYSLFFNPPASSIPSQA